MLSCYMAIAAGTMFGGWRVGGFCAETDEAMTLFLATALGVPVSTTHLHRCHRRRGLRAAGQCSAQGSGR